MTITETAETPYFCRKTTVSNAPASRPDLEIKEHLLGSFVGDTSGPTLIVIGGIHGNEPAGYFALKQLVPEVESVRTRLNGRVFFLAGNVKALERNVRFLDADLNRFWTDKNISSIGCDGLNELAEGREMAALEAQLDRILITAMDEVYVIDLHSTSADGAPFATIGDTLRNRAFAQKFPYPILLGIEEELDGTMLEYLNNAGAVTLGFEGGSHTSSRTVENHMALVRLALSATGLISDNVLAERSAARVARTAAPGTFIEIVYRHEIDAHDQFKMKPGFNNFDPIGRNEVVGHDARGDVLAPKAGMILMPLYQALGNDGFFIGRRVSAFWLKLSALLRRTRLPRIIHYLPGVTRDPDDPKTFKVNTRIARLFPLQIFHLLGLRKRRWSEDTLIVSRRRFDTDDPFGWSGGRRYG